MSDAAPVSVGPDGKILYRASALGGCDKALLAARLGYDPIPLPKDAKINKVFEAGHRIEEQVIATHYPDLRDQQSEIRLIVNNHVDIIGHIDGYDWMRPSVVEIKSQGEEEWDRFEREGWEAGFFPKYKWQASAYMYGFTTAFGSPSPLQLVRALRDENYEWTGDVAISHVTQPFYTMAELRNRVLRIEIAATTGVLQAECINSYPCPFFYLHDEIDRDLIDGEALDILAREYEEARKNLTVAKGVQANARRALREASEKDKFSTTSGIKVTFYEANDPPRLDKELLEAFLEKHERKLKEFQKQGKSERLRVTMPKDEGEG